MNPPECWTCGHGLHTGGVCMADDCGCGDPCDARPMRDAVRRLVSLLDQGHPAYFLYEPGNMTRYEVMFVDLDNRVECADVWSAQTYGYEGVLVTLTNFRHGYVFVLRDRTDRGPLVWQYIGDKLKLGEGDARAIERLFEEVTDEFARQRAA